MKPLNPPIADWHGRRVWIVGASSGIGAALARRLSGSGAVLALSARREDALREMARAGEEIIPFDVRDAAATRRAGERLLARWGRIDLVVYCAGVYTPMRAWEIDEHAVRESLEINLQGLYHLLGAVIPHFVARRSGAICLVASGAGYTGLPKALAYGPTKAAMINLAQILYTDLSPRGVGVYLVNPGFVATRLTAKNDFDMPALIGPERAAEEIVAGIRKGRFEIHFPRRFTLWMRLLSRLPDRIRFYLLKRAAA